MSSTIPSTDITRPHQSRRADSPSGSRTYICDIDMGIGGGTFPCPDTETASASTRRSELYFGIRPSTRTLSPSLTDPEASADAILQGFPLSSRIKNHPSHLRLNTTTPSTEHGVSFLATVSAALATNDNATSTLATNVLKLAICEQVVKGNHVLRLVGIGVFRKAVCGDNCEMNGFCGIRDGFEGVNLVVDVLAVLFRQRVFAR